MSIKHTVRIGIDVGGTFTHAVAVDSLTLRLISKSKVPTTHHAKEGVAAGVIEALDSLLKNAGIKPEDVAFIAHSTTQATNALLEGDVATVGVIGMGKGANAWLAQIATNPGEIGLAPGKFLKTNHYFINTTKTPSKADFKTAFETLLQKGAQAFVVSEAFAPDDQSNEKLAISVAEEMNLLASAGSEISQLYGLKVRTRTAVLNASMLPKMLETANLTEQCVHEAGIKAPLMIMRSDGGVMDITAMRHRPILSMLSGPAAGVAAAMMYLHISDGIFVEVGGTSSDISVITNGRAQIRSAEIGGHKVFMRTLDVRTVGVAGGSMARINRSNIIEVGPRSAHIAGLKYVAFGQELKDPTVELISPTSGDPSDYLAISSANDSSKYCLTTTCAANLFGIVPGDNVAYGNRDNIQKAFDVLATYLNKSAKDCAEEFLTKAAMKCEPVIKAFIKEKKLDTQTLTLYGGGGGAAALVPYLSKRLNLKFQLAESADVISAIGVALALIRETIEKQILNPTNDDILKIRQEAQIAIEKMGAAPSSVEIFVEIDPQTSIVRATATGAASMVETNRLKEPLSQEQRLNLVAESIQLPVNQIKSSAQTEYFQAYTANKIKTNLFGLIKTHNQPLRILDQSGTIRFQARQAEVILAKSNEAKQAISTLASQLSTWGDAGRTVPNIILFAGTKIIDLSSLMTIEQITSLATAELDNLPTDTQVIIVATKN